MIVKTYWWRDRLNFGDQITSHLLQHYAGLDAQWSPAAEADLISTGSILGHVPADWTGNILGSGKLFEHDKVPENARVWALRGPLSAKGIRGDYALGDPGLLADELVPRPVRTHKLGILPHWSDRTLTQRTEWDQFSPLRIYPDWEPLDVLAAIGSCDKLVTSSLHGVIVADAFGIPRRFEPTPRLHKEGGFLKHLDYNASIGHKFEVGVTSQPSRFKINDRRDELIDAFEDFASWIRSNNT
jgi:pyruvyltransferase